jgi:hypothetical protein
MDRHTARRERLIRAGRCVRCGTEAVAAGTYQCAGCLDTQRQAARARRATRKAQGLCRLCAKPVYDRWSLCLKHLQRQGVLRITQQRHWYRLGRCTRCFKQPRAPRRRQCEPCLVKQRVRDRKRYARRTGRAEATLQGKGEATLQG